MKMLKWALAAVTASMLVACGGGGGGAGTSPFGGGGCSAASAASGVGCTASAKSVDVLASVVQVGTGGDTISISATVKDSSNVALKNVAVSFSASSGSISGASSTTDSSGVAKATFSAGSDRSNRQATITVTSGSAKGTIDIDITGTVVSYSGVTTVALGQTVTVSAKAVDSKGAVISGLPLTIASSLGNGLSATTITTGSAGTATVDYTATNAGADTLTFTGGGASAAPTVQVSAANFTFVAPTANVQIPVTTSQAITVQYLSAGSPVAGATVSFSATAGTVTPSTAVTDAAGRASVSVSSTTASSAILQASVGAAVQATLPVSFVSQAANRIVLQVTPTAIGPNTSGSTAQQAQLIATVTDVNANPVSGATVAFNRITDPSSGSLSQATAITDRSGQATVQYIAGSLTTASNGVEIRADVLGTAVTTFSSNPTLNRDAFITVNRSALFISMSTGNTIFNLNEQTYRKDFDLYVTDANGVGVPNVSLTLKVLPTRYFKGTLAFSGSWQYAGTPHICPNEDFDPLLPNSPNNYNGVLDPGEDANSSGKLEPGNVVLLSTGTAVTNTLGTTTISLYYGEQFVPWVEVMLVAQARVSGTESSNSQTFTINGSASDFTSATVPPAGVVSPFGTQVCTSKF